MKLLKQILIIFLLLKGVEMGAQQGIGTNNANSDAVLDINATDKGVLLPRIALTSASSLLPVTGTASDAHNGMTVYNTNPDMVSGLAGEGYYFWSGGATGNWNHIISTPVAFNSDDFMLWNGSHWEPSNFIRKSSLFSIWTEENVDLNNNAFEWSFGNGNETLASQGIPIPVSAELFAIGVSLVGANATTINVIINGVSVATTNPYTGTGTDITNLLTPVSITAGDLINFQTNLAGGANKGKVVAWLRAESTSPFYVNELSDVDTNNASAQENDILRWDGTQWTAHTVEGVFVDSLDHLFDVVAESIQGSSAKLLRWNSNEWTSSDGANASASISNASTINFNSSTTFTDQPLAALNFNEFMFDVTFDGTGFTIQTAGTYHISYSGVFTSTGARATTITRINAGGTVGGQDFVYVRAFNNINDGAASGSMVVQLNVNDTVRLQSRQEGTVTNAVNTDAIGAVSMSITRLN